MTDNVELNNAYAWEYLNNSGFAPMYLEIANMITHFGSKHVLDIGCGFSRVNEFLPSTVRVDGVDTFAAAIEECNERWLGKYTIGDAFVLSDLEYDDYDCLLLSGLLYYLNSHSELTPHEYIDMLVEKFNPKHIIIAEPMPSISYNSPDYSILLDSWAWVAKTVHMPDERMGDRTVYTLFTDKKRPERKVKAAFNDSSSFDHNEQQNFDDKLLKHWVYVLNTEAINSDRDGEVFPITQEIEQYVGVAAGYKLMYKACLDWYPGKPMHFMYIDIVQQALDYRMYIDKTAGGLEPNDCLRIYIRDVNSKMLTYPDNAAEVVNDTVDSQLEELGIEKSTWDAFLKEYKNAEKTYVRIDAVNNIKLFASILDTQEPTWFWYSNMHDWHQFRFTSNTFDNWCKYLTDRNTQLKLVGKTPPFTSD